MSAMDRYDAMTIASMLTASVAIGLNLIFLQADSALGAGRGDLVLVPIFAGLLIAASGLVAHIRRHGRDMVIVSRIWVGSLTYLVLSAACSAAFQPRFE